MPNFKIILCGFLLAVALPFTATAQHNPVSYINRIIDWTRLGNGKVYGLRRAAGLYAPKADTVSGFRSDAFSYRFFPGKPTTFERIFADPVDEDVLYLVVRYRSDGAVNRMIYRRAGYDIDWGLITQPFDDASFHQTKRGEIFIYSRDGILVRIFDGKIEHFHLPDSEGLVGNRNKLREIKCVESPSGVVAFYSIVDPGIEKKALRDVVVYDEGWKLHSLGGRRTGPAFFSEPTQLRFVAPGQVFTLDIKSGAIVESDSPAVVVGDTAMELRPVDVIFDPQNKPHILWRNFYRSPLRYDVDAIEGGRFLRATTLETSEQGEFQWRDANVTFDYDLYRDRFSLTDSHGNWWVVGSGAIWRRTPDGGWTEFGFRYGINPDPACNHAKIDNDNRLWLMNTADSYFRTAVIELDHLEAGPQLSDRWQQIYQKRALVRYDGHYFSNVDRDDNVHIWTKNGLQISKLPLEKMLLDAEDSPAAYDPRNDQLVTAATGEIWWRNAKGDSIAWYQNNEWTQLENDADRQKGSIWDQAVSRRKQMGLPVGHFDFAESEDGNSTSGQPSFFRLDKEESGEGVLPVPDTFDMRACPVGDHSRPSINSKQERIVRSADRIAVASPNGRWHLYAWKSDLEASLLREFVVADDSGRLFVQQKGYYKTDARVIWFDPERVELTSVEKSLGKLDRPNLSLAPRWNLISSEDAGADFNTNSQYQWRVDNGPWSRWLDVSVEPVIYALPVRGAHELEIRVAVPGAFVENESLSYSFETDYDFSATIDPLLQQLDSDSFEERESAIGELAKFGIGAIPSLRNTAESGTPTARVNAVKVIELIESQAGSGQHYVSQNGEDQK